MQEQGVASNASAELTQLAQLRADDLRRGQADFTLPICKAKSERCTISAAKWCW
jgi:hypothetical protein